MSAISAAARRLQAALGPVIEMRFPADDPIRAASMAKLQMEALTDMFLDLSEALKAEAASHGADMQAWTEDRDVCAGTLLSGWDSAVSAMEYEARHLAGATRAEARREERSGK